MTKMESLKYKIHGMERDMEFVNNEASDVMFETLEMILK